MVDRTWLVILAALAACGDDGNAVPDASALDAPAQDAAPSPDADPSIAPLVGTWTRAPEVPTNIGLLHVTFRADGTATVQGNSGPPDQGMFAVPSPGRLRLTFATVQESDYAIDGDRMAVVAFLAQGTVTGFVGTWTLAQLTDGVASTATVVVRDDESATYSLTGPKGTVDFDGTWALAGPGFELTVTRPAPLTFQFFPVGPGAISYLPLVRASP